MIRFQCDKCGKSIHVDDSAAGKFGKCPGCGERVKVPPIPGSIGPASATAQPEVTQAGPASQRQRASRPGPPPARIPVAPPPPAAPIETPLPAKSSPPRALELEVTRSPVSPDGNGAKAKLFQRLQWLLTDNREFSQAGMAMGAGGAALTAIAVFLPMIDLPLGWMNYLRDAGGNLSDGALVLAIALTAAACCGIKRFRIVAVAGLVMLALITYSFASWNSILSAARESLVTKPDDGGFDAIASAFGSMVMMRVGLSWGWALLFAGSVLTIVGAFLACQPRDDTNNTRALSAAGVCSALTAGIIGLSTWAAGGGRPLVAFVLPGTAEGAFPVVSAAGAHSTAKGGADAPAATGRRMAVSPFGETADSVDAAPSPDWNAATKRAELDGIGVEVISVSVGKVSATGLFDSKSTSKDSLLKICLKIENLTDSKKVEYESWSEFSSFSDSNVALEDDVGNAYRRVSFGLGDRVDGQLGNESIYPSKSVSDVLVFEPPVEKAKYLKLTLPAEAFDGTGNLLLKIGIDRVKRD